MLYRNIPWYFKDSELYRNLDDNDLDQDIEIPEEYTYNTSVNSLEDTIKVLKIAQYWNFDYLPDIFYDYLMQYKDECLIYFYKNRKNGKIKYSLIKLLENLNPNCESQIYWIFKLKKSLKCSLEEIINYVIQNKSCLLFFYSNKEKCVKDLNLICSLLDGIKISLSWALNHEYDSYNLPYIKTLYPVYKNVEDEWHVLDYFPKMIEDISKSTLMDFKNAKFSYEFIENQNHFFPPKNEKFTIFEILILTCLENNRYIDEFFSEGNLDMKSIFKLFIDLEYNYDPEIIFSKIPPNEDKFVEDKMGEIRARAYIINYLIKNEEPKIIKKLKKINWKKIKPKNYEDFDFIIPKEDLEMWHLKAIKDFLIPFEN